MVQSASFSVKPIKPKKLLNLALGFFMAVFGGLGLAFFTEYLDHSFNKPEDILRKLELPVVAAIPFLPSQSLLLSGLPMPALQSMTNSFSSTRKKGHHNLLEYAGCSESLQECLIQAPGDTTHALCGKVRIREKASAPLSRTSPACWQVRATAVF